MKAKSLNIVLPGGYYLMSDQYNYHLFCFGSVQDEATVNYWKEKMRCLCHFRYIAQIRSRYAKDCSEVGDSLIQEVETIHVAKVTIQEMAGKYGYYALPLLKGSNVLICSGDYRLIVDPYNYNLYRSVFDDAGELTEKLVRIGPYGDPGSVFERIIEDRLRNSGLTTLTAFDDAVNVEILADKIIITKAYPKKIDIDALFKDYTGDYRGEEFDWSPPQGGEAW